MKIGLLTCALPPEPVLNAHGPFLSMFQDLLAGQGFTFENWNVEGMDFPTAPDQADAWLITGARHGAYENHAFIPPLEQFVRDAFAQKAPMIGICFGHQIIAQALGGTVEKFDGGWAIGYHDYDIGGETYHLNAWHQDQVTKLPDGAERTGSNAFCENAMLHYAGKALTIQPHPEFDAASIESLLLSRAKGVVPDDLQQVAKDRLPLDDNNAKMGMLLAHFLKTKSLT